MQTRLTQSSKVGAVAVIPSHYFHNVTGIVTMTGLSCGGPLTKVMTIMISINKTTKITVMSHLKTTFSLRILTIASRLAHAGQSFTSSVLPYL